jgi:hypothetical protein
MTPTVIAGITIAVAVLLLAFAIRNWRRGAATSAWPQTEAEIVRSFVAVDKSTDADTFTATIEYEYQVAGISHRGARVRYGAYASSNRGAAERAVAAFRVGSRCPVFVNPANPKDAVLLRGTSWTNLVIAGAGCIFAIVGVFVYLNGN